METRSAQDTIRLGRTVGEEAVPRSLVVIDGELGTGKTVFAHGIAQGLNITSWRGSPTFNLIHEYTGRLPFFHMDAYRIETAEFLDLDFDAVMSGGGLVAIEWGGKLLAALRAFDPARLIHVRLEDGGGDTRRIEIVQ
ncbi:MAG TPA: tRNA (adenosine(37)-N6)-threonylcarbamoyltransferase complex ATPase subunit type 1 TsaE [Chloroflexota bacterium]|nr:tRNA (adenosine(37)-N6)-threonylcarbamoyltransferase complex ATPase subunit type 1 TsaE [Chloroflexota bacterium]